MSKGHHHQYQGHFPAKGKKRRRLIILAVAFLVVILAAAVFLIYWDQQKQKSYQYDGEVASGGNYAEEIEYKGKKYKYNNQLMSILLIGVDSTGKLQSTASYGSGGQADSIGLIILDRHQKTVKVLPLSRDTYTAVHTYTRQGYDNGTIDTHLGFAYTFGDGGTGSCKNTCLAVSDLLKGVNVHYYVAANLDSMTFANDLVGGVTVTVPNDDVAHLHPELTKDARVTLNSDNVKDFIRYRNTNINGSNNGRMARAQAFYQGFIEKVESLTEDDLNQMWEKVQQENNAGILTSFNQAGFLKIMEYLHQFTYSPETGNLVIEGRDDLLEGRDIFYPDSDQLMELVVNTFYIEK